MNHEIRQQLTQILNSKIKALENCYVTKNSFQEKIYGNKIQMSQLENKVHNRIQNNLSQSYLGLDQLSREWTLNKQKIREAIVSFKSDIRLEMSLEKGRIRDSFMAQQLKFQDLSARIDTEGSNGHAGLGKLRHDIFYSFVGFIFTSAAAVLGYLRYFM